MQSANLIHAIDAQINNEVLAMYSTMFQPQEHVWVPVHQTVDGLGDTTTHLLHEYAHKDRDTALANCAHLGNIVGCVFMGELEVDSTQG